MEELFKNIDEISKCKILQELEAITSKYEKNKMIMSSVKNDDIICLIMSGHIQVIKNDANGNHIIIEDLYEGDIFGSISANISSNDFEIITKEESTVTILELDNIYAYNNNIDLYNTFIKNLIK